MDSQPVEPVVVGQVTPDLVELTVDGVGRRIAVARYGAAHFVDSPLGASVFTEADRFPCPTSRRPPVRCIAPMPGAIVRVECQVRRAGHHRPGRWWCWRP